MPDIKKSFEQSVATAVCFVVDVTTHSV